MTKDWWKDYLLNIGWVDTTVENGTDERVIRKAISELRKEGVIFIPTGKHTYFNVERVTIEDARQFAIAQKKAWLTQYFNTVKPLERYLSEEDKKELYGVLV